MGVRVATPDSTGTTSAQYRFAYVAPGSVPTSTSLVASTTAPAVGRPVSFYAGVSSSTPGAGTPTGTVRFATGASVVPGCGAVALSAGGQRAPPASPPQGPIP